MTLHNIPPGLLLIGTALLVPVLPARARSWVAMGAAGLAFYLIMGLESGATLTMALGRFQLDLLRVDKWSKAFGYIFTLSAFAAFLYGAHEKRSGHLAAALLYIGSALMVVFAGDLFTLYFFWEAMAVTSVNLVLGGGRPGSVAAAKRYILVHVAGGLVLLAGILLHVHQTGSVVFTALSPTSTHVGAWLILVGFLVNAAAVPFSSWLPDAYPESSVLGGVILSAYTSKTAVYTLLRGFPGWEILIIVGCVMSVYGIIYALLENDMRRILAYSIINQVGFMVTGVGIGTVLALNGAVAHAFCHIIYKALLWMSAGAVLYRTGKSKCTDLGGLYQTMPWTLLLGGIGALAISSVPLTSGYTSKTMIITAAANQHLFWAWLVLEIASAGVFLHAGIKFPYFVFFAKDKGLRPPEAPMAMRAAMGILAFFCLYLGMFPERLYDILPNTEQVKAVMPFTFSDIYINHFSHVVTQSQMLIFSGLVFFLFLPLLQRTDTISIDFDWLYRRGCVLVYRLLDEGLNAANLFAYRLLAEKLPALLRRFVEHGPYRVVQSITTEFWAMTGVDETGRQQAAANLEVKYRRGSFSVAASAITALVVLLGVLLL